MNIPNLFIIGAPKSGSTSIYNQLSFHPEIFCPKIKELKYFASDIYYDDPRDYPFKTLTDYLKIYDNKDSLSSKFRVDGTVFVMYSMNSIKNILSLNKNAKFILILRDPLEASKSMHNQRLKSFNKSLREVSDDFYTCWDYLKTRKLGSGYPSNCKNKFLFRYDLLYSYELYLPQIQSLISRENLLFIDYNNIKNNITKVHQDIFSFLNISNYSLPLTTLNKKKGFKNTFINKIIFFLINNYPRILKKNFFIKKNIKLLKFFLNFLIKKNFIKKNKKKDAEIKLFFKKSYETMFEIFN